MTTLTFKKDWEPADISNSTFAIIVKKEGKEDEDAISVKTYEVEDGKNGQLDIKLSDLDERGDYILYIKAIDWEDKYTVKEIPLTIK
jgi:hypothetical protein